MLLSTSGWEGSITTIRKKETEDTNTIVDKEGRVQSQSAQFFFVSRKTKIVSRSIRRLDLAAGRQSAISDCHNNHSQCRSTQNKNTTGCAIDIACTK